LKFLPKQSHWFWHLALLNLYQIFLCKITKVFTLFWGFFCSKTYLLYLSLLHSPKIVVMRKLSLGQKVLIANLSIIFIFALTATFSIITLRNSREAISRSATAINPSVEVIDNFVLMVSRSRMYITNWVLLPVNEADKEALKELHNFEFPALKEKVSKLKKTWQKPEDIAEIDSIIIRFDELLIVQKQIMENFKVFGDYNDPNKVFYANELIENKVIPISYALTDRLELLSKAKRYEKEVAEREVAHSLRQLNNIILLLGIASVFTAFIASLFIFKSVSSPIRYVNQVAQELSLGGLPKDYTREFGSDEIGEMARSMRTLVNGLKATSEFAENIGRGIYQQDYQPLSSHDILGNSLINMRNNLQKVAEEDKLRAWATEGIAKFGDIMRQNYTSIVQFAGEIIINLSNYVKANQGGIFIIDEHSETDPEPFMTLQACYAWDRQKYLERKIYRGEGLAGQAWQEKRTIYVTAIPQDYVHITSGLGKSNPTSLLIVPIKVNEAVFGVIEMAFFRPLQPHEIAFIERVAENFASTLSIVRNNERTQKLLEDSQLLTEQLRAQEEEMKQNVEELQATQEEMKRTQKEVEDKEEVINALSLIIETDQNFIVQRANHNIDSYLGYHITDVLGQPFAKFFESNVEFVLMSRFLEGGKQYQKMISLVSQEGKPVVVKVSGAALVSSVTGSLHYLFLIDLINMAEVRKFLEKQTYAVSIS
jgi:HAMP domain-containing protein/PAS domain-containing protein